MRADLELDANKIFSIRGHTWHYNAAGDCINNKIGSWIIRGAIIISQQDQTLDVAMTATILEEGETGLFELTIETAERDRIFQTFCHKNALSYEIRANFPNGQGMMLARGNLFLIRSRLLSS